MTRELNQYSLRYALVASLLMVVGVAALGQEQRSLGEIARENRESKSHAPATSVETSKPCETRHERLLPIAQSQLLSWQIAGMPSNCIAAEVNARGLMFEVTPAIAQSFGDVGFSNELIEVLRSAKQGRFSERVDLPGILVEIAQNITGGNYHHAVYKLDLLVKAYSNSADLLVAYGFALSRSGNWEAARDAYERALQLDPGFAYAHGQLSSVLSHLGQAGRAEIEARRMLSLQPENPEARRHLAKALSLRMQLRMDSGMTSERAIQVPAKIASLAYEFNRSGLTKYNQGDFAGALADYRRASEVNPSEPTYVYNAGLAQRELGHADEVIALQLKVIALDPTNMKAREELGYAYWTTRQYQKAIEVYREMLRIDPTFKHSVIQQNLVCALDENGEHAEARRVEAETNHQGGRLQVSRP